MNLEAVIGLEVHAELDTKTKLFCGCLTAFGAEPNTQTCPVCLGMPGVLPVLNGQALEYALRAALALGCDINRTTTFDRKNYYYPDLPKNYQISQNYRPLGVDGSLSIPLEEGVTEVRIHNVHLEEDAGKLLHPEDDSHAGSLVDLNRAGTPLLEIVTYPDMRGLREVESFMHTLRDVLLYTQVSDCKMQEGSLRFEASVSMRPDGQEELGSRVEIKNLNSMAAVLKVLEYEIRRQSDALGAGRTVPQETRLWNELKGRSERMRTKEEAHDYRYFPEPDLVPVQVSDRWLKQIRRSIPELPAQRRSRLATQYGLSEYDASLLTADKTLADFFEECVRHLDQPKDVCNWITNQTLAALKEKNLQVSRMKMLPEHLAALVSLVKKGEISQRNASELLPQMVVEGTPPHQLVKSRKLKQITDTADLETIAEKVISENPKAVADWQSGKKRALNALLGGIMRETHGRARADLAREVLERKLAKP